MTEEQQLQKLVEKVNVEFLRLLKDKPLPWVKYNSATLLLELYVPYLSNPFFFSLKDVLDVNTLFTIGQVASSASVQAYKEGEEQKLKEIKRALEI